MGNYLHAKSLCLIPRPVDAVPSRTAATPTPPSANAIAEVQEKQQAWEANGLIMLKVAYSLHGQQGTSAYHTWHNLHAMFDVQGAAALFNDFQKVVNYHISGSKHPGAEINALAEMLHQLHTNNVQLLDFIKSMLLLNSLPPLLSIVTTIALQTHTSAQLCFSDLRGDIITEYERKKQARGS